MIQPFLEFSFSNETRVEWVNQSEDIDDRSIRVPAYRADFDQRDFSVLPGILVQPDSNIFIGREGATGNTGYATCPVD